MAAAQDAIADVEVEAVELAEAARENKVTSILDRLRAPNASDLSRKRRLVVNTGGNRRAQGKVSAKKAVYEPKISAEERVEKFKDETLKVVRGNTLFCQSCKEEISVKKSNLSTHISSKKHKTNKEKQAKMAKRENDIAEALTIYDAEHHPKGEKLSTSTRVFRVKVVQAFLKSGTPLNRVEYFRELFEEADITLTSQSNLRQLIPFILEEEYKMIYKELMGKDVSIVFDGTTRDGEALVVLVRFVDNWELKGRLVRFQLVKSSVCGDELARIVIEVLHRKLDVSQGHLLAAMRDRAPVNTCALRTVSVLYPDMLDVGCISHFLDRVGVKCKTPVLRPFMSTWNLVFTTSMKARRVWKEISGRGMPRYNPTRWWSLWECMKVVFEEWQHVTAFLESNEAFAEASRRKLSESVEQSSLQIRVEQAAVMELEKFVKATYTLEGDGTLVLVAFEKLEELREFIRVQNFATLTRVIQELFPLNVAEQQRWYHYAVTECLLPAFQYYLETSANDAVVSRSIQVFRAAQLFNPRVVKVSRPVAVDVDLITAVPFLNDDNVIQSLKDELPAYLVRVANIPDEFDALTDTWPWWRHNEAELPAWSSAVKKIVLVQPSSAAAERVFSLLVTMFGDQQHETLEDYIEAALMLRVNR